MKFVRDKPLPDRLCDWTEAEVRQKDWEDTVNLEQGHIADPMERMIHEALSDAGIEFGYAHDGTSAPFPHLDFTLPDGVYIEVKMFHSDRIAAQMGRADNVIAVQGKKAGEFMARAIRALGKIDE